VKQSAPRALTEARRQFGVRSDVQARLVSGLPAPRSFGLRPTQVKWIISCSTAYFHALRVSRGDMNHSLEIRDFPGIDRTCKHRLRQRSCLGRLMRIPWSELCWRSINIGPGTIGELSFATQPSELVAEVVQSGMGRLDLVRIMQFKK
jgi:hypothetical protein